MGSKKMRMYLMPTLSDKQKLDRLDLSLNEIDADALTFGKKYNEVMIDEALFYLRKDGVKARCMKNPDGSWSTFETARTKSKRFVVERRRGGRESVSRNEIVI